jgi:hypothetical protein
MVGSSDQLPTDLETLAGLSKVHGPDSRRIGEALRVFREWVAAKDAELGEWDPDGEVMVELDAEVGRGQG